MTVSVGPISDQNSMLTVSATQPWTTWVLQRALTVRNNVVVDISASGLSPSPQLAADIAERIAAKVPG
jgi:hypothetical protein